MWLTSDPDTPVQEDDWDFFETVTSMESLQMRTGDELMDIDQLASTKPYRLSFARTLVQRMTTERWVIEPKILKVDVDGIGTAIYDIAANGHQITFVAFSDDVPEERRTGRLSEQRFDGMGFLCHGEVTTKRLKAERESLMLRSRGRTDWETLGWTLATRSKRSFMGLVDLLASGGQPEQHTVASSGGYLFRNNGYYGNGRHGTRMWQSLPDDHPLSHPYHPEMFALYLWRQFGFDLAEEMARIRSPEAAQLQPDYKRTIGIGNSTGQGISTFLTKWPGWMHAWIGLREEAIVRASNALANKADIERARELLRRAISYLALRDGREDSYSCPDSELISNLTDIEAKLDALVSVGGSWSPIVNWARSHCHLEAADVLHSILTETYSDLVDDLDEEFATRMNRVADVNPCQTVAELRELVSERYDWTKEWHIFPNFFYRSEEHGEQRVGIREFDDGENVETFTALCRDVANLRSDLAYFGDNKSVGLFLLSHPNHRFLVERIQTFGDDDYAEIRANLVDDSWIPAKAGRFVLSNFGMELSTAHNHRYVQGIFFQGAPLPEDLKVGREIDWIYPSV